MYELILKLAIGLNTKPLCGFKQSRKDVFLHTEATWYLQNVSQTVCVGFYDGTIQQKILPQLQNL